MLNPKGFLKKDLDQAIKFYDRFNYYLNKADDFIGKDNFFEARRQLEQAIEMTHSLESLKKDKFLYDLKKEIDRQNQDDQESVVKKLLSNWKK